MEKHRMLLLIFAIRNLPIVDSSGAQPGNYKILTLAELYDLLAEETIMFNKKLIQKSFKEEFKDLKKSIREIQEEIRTRRLGV
jgi:hypothetical protein